MQAESNEKFIYSVVMAVYNTEPFLREAVESLIAQDIGFERVQLIMVDDGSTDGSGAICDGYAASYPENVLALHKENGGVSSARNEGLKHVVGRYVNFMDSDDKMSSDAFRKVFDFFAEHEGEADVVSIPIEFFDGQTGEHALNNKFHGGTRVIDLDVEYDSTQMSAASAFFSAASLKGVSFDDRLVHGEDAKAVIQVLLKKRTLGVVAEAAYHYRKRLLHRKSIMQSVLYAHGAYSDYLKNFSEATIDLCLSTQGNVPRFVQYTLMYDLQWKARQTRIPAGVLNGDEIREYRDAFYSLLTYIDDGIILAQRNIDTELKRFLMYKKHAAAFTDAERPTLLPNLLWRLSKPDLAIDFIRIDNAGATVEGRFSVPVYEKRGFMLSAELDGGQYNCSVTRRDRYGFSMDEAVSEQWAFSFSFPFSDDIDRHGLAFACVFDGVRYPACLSFRNFSPVGSEYDAAYYLRSGRKLTTSGDKLLFDKCGAHGRARSELRFLRELWGKNRLGARKAVFARVFYHLTKPFKRKRLWLISDRINKADDNGEALFEFLLREKPAGVRAVFALSRDSSDYRRLRELGPVVNYGSRRYKLLFLLADCIISAQADNATTNPFDNYWQSYRDILADKAFVFLQHGIIHDDLSNWLNRYNKNISGFVTSAKAEYASILQGGYGYPEQNVWLTGLPRHDKLYRDEKRRITVMPTWRQYLMSGLAYKTGLWSEAGSFAESDYVRFYSSLLNDGRLLDAAQELGYTLCFMPHPNIMAHLDCFSPSNEIECLSIGDSYRKVFAESELVVTDYSSAAFDFAYLRKPVIYCQFDAEEFFSGKHICAKGYFDYERDGFGEVERDLESTVERIIEYMENGCALKEKYRERIDGFFAFNDRNNCRRVYEKILELNDRE